MRQASSPDIELGVGVGELRGEVAHVTGKVARIDADTERHEDQIRELRSDVEDIKRVLGTPPTLDAEGTGVAGLVYEMHARGVGGSRRRSMATSAGTGALAAALIAIVTAVAQQLQRPNPPAPVPAPINAPMGAR